MCPKDFLEYDKRFVFFIDVLGFKDLVEKSSKPKEIKQIVDLLKNDFITANKTYNLHLAITSVSDCIIVSFKKEAKFILDKILYIISFVQANAIAKYGLLFRGAGTYGDMIHNDEYQFGRAYQHAYHLESKFAIYPRVILEKEYINSLKKEEKESCLEFLKESDMYYYIDYLSNEVSSDDDCEKQKEFFVKIRNFILKKMNTEIRHMDKYLWLKYKYNIAIDKFNMKFLQNEKLI